MREAEQGGAGRSIEALHNRAIVAGGSIAGSRRKYRRRFYTSGRRTVARRSEGDGERSPAQLAPRALQRGARYHSCGTSRRIVLMLKRGLKQQRQGAGVKQISERAERTSRHQRLKACSHFNHVNAGRASTALSRKLTYVGAARGEAGRGEERPRQAEVKSTSTRGQPSGYRVAYRVPPLVWAGQGWPADSPARLPAPPNCPGQSIPFIRPCPLLSLALSSHSPSSQKGAYRQPPATVALSKEPGWVRHDRTGRRGAPR